MVDEAGREGRRGVVPRLPGVHGIVLAGSYPNGRSFLDALMPRPLLPVAQRPLVTYALRFLRSGGLCDATVCVNSAARAVQQLLRSSSDPSLRLEYLEDWSPRGTAGCLQDAASRTEAATFVVVDGTSVPMLNLGRLVEAHVASEAAVTVVVSPLRSSQCTGQRPTGVYVVDRRVLEHIPSQGFQDIKEKLLPRLYAAGESVRTFAARDVSPRAVSLETYLALEHWMLARLPDGSAALDGFGVHGETMAHHTAVVEPGARLLGPVLLGPRVCVRRGATIVGPASLGDGTRVGAGSVVSRSALWSGCEVGERAFVDRSLLAEGARVKAGAALHTALSAPADPGRTGAPRRRAPLRVSWNALGAALRPSTSGHS